MGYQTDHKIFSYLPDLTYELKDVTDKEIYKYFDLTKDEINLIE